VCRPQAHLRCRKREGVIDGASIARSDEAFVACAMDCWLIFGYQGLRESTVQYGGRVGLDSNLSEG